MKDFKDYSETPLSEISRQHLSSRLAFICREIRYKKQELTELGKEKDEILKEIEKRHGGQNNV